MADNQYLSQDDFAQKLKELGYFPSSTPVNEAENAAMQPPVSSPIPINEAAAEELSNAHNPDFQTEFPEPTRVAQTDQDKTTQPEVSQSNIPTVPPVNINVPVASPKSTNPLENSELNDEALKNAQNQAQNKQLFTGIGNALATVAAAPSGKPVDESFFNQQMANAQQPVQNIETRRGEMIRNQTLTNSLLDSQLKKLTVNNTQQANDPNSEVSKTARGLYQMLHPGIEKTPEWEQSSAAFLKEFGQHILEQEAKLEATKEATNSRIAANKEASEKRSGEASVKDSRKRLTDMNTKLSPNRRQTGQLGQANTNYHAAERLEGLVSRTQLAQEPFNFTGPESEEFALGVARLLSTGGAQARSQVEALVPHSARGKVNDMVSWVTNNPKGREQQEFVKRMYGTALTEKEIARQQIHRAKLELVAPFEDLRQNPDYYNDWLRNMESAGLTEDEYDQSLAAHGKERTIDSSKIKEKLEAADIIPSQSFPRQVSRIDPTTKKIQYAIVKDKNELSASSQKGFK